jgi:hypothetical protein
VNPRGEPLAFVPIGAMLFLPVQAGCGMACDSHTTAGAPALPPDRANRLIHEASPYLLQHARNPVDWYPWGDEAPDRARREDKPIFLSIAMNPAATAFSNCLNSYGRRC